MGTPPKWPRDGGFNRFSGRLSTGGGSRGFHPDIGDGSEEDMSYVYPLHDGKAIGALSQNLLDVDTMEVLSHHPVELCCDPFFLSHLLCASVNQGVAIFSLHADIGSPYRWCP